MMRALLQPNKNKRALSNIVAYVLLIAITISLSVMVYGWLRFYVSEDEVETCSDGVNIIIRSYECFKDSRLNITLKNKGRFTVDGYVLRVHDREGAAFGIYTFDEAGVVIEPGEEHFQNYLFNDANSIQDDGYKLSTVTLVEVQPFMKENNGEIKCKAYASQEITCLT
ncbi:hypothetical protein HN935_03195 [archaeon]|jgi:flagellin-like protein|nr:hypothetical protein [archaeon]